MIRCKGNGECLIQNEHTLEYYKKNNVICNYNCVTLHCPNYIICGSMAPKYILDMQNDLCYYCNSMFSKGRGKGKLIAIDNVECPICLETTQCVTHPMCDHYSCVECFRRCYYGDYNDEPPFPYSDDHKEAYYKDYNNPLWQNDKKIKKWLKDWKKWNKKREDKYESEEYLRMCPICRK